MYAFLRALVLVFTVSNPPPIVTCKEALDVFGREWTSYGRENKELVICSYPENMRLVLEACNEEEAQEKDQCVDVPQRVIEEIRGMLRTTIAKRASIDIRGNCLVFGKEEEPHKYISTQE